MRGTCLFSAALLCIFAICGQPVAKGTPPAQAKLELWADMDRTTRSIYYGAERDVYVWCTPEIRGLDAAELALVLPPDVLMTGFTVNPAALLSIGDPVSGFAEVFSSCQNNPLWLFHAKCFITSATNNWEYITVGPHPDSGHMQYLPCEGDFPEIDFVPPTCIQECVTVNYHNQYEPIHITNVTIESPISLLPDFDGGIDLGLNEPLWSNFKLRNASDRTDSIRCIYATEHPNPFVLVLERPMAPGTTYILEAFLVSTCGCWWGNVTYTFLYPGGFAPLPDLSVAPFSFAKDRPSSCVPLPMPFHVSNNGAAACDSFTVALNYVASYNPRVERRIMAKRYGGIAPGDTLYDVFNIEPDAMDHHSFFVLRADDENEIAEWTEINNWVDGVQVSNHNPMISSIVDVPADGGGSVTLVFYRSDYEQIKYNCPNTYHVLRRIGHSDEWEDVAAVPGRRINSYSVNVPTVVDSSASTTDYWSTYKVDLVTVLDASTTVHHTSCPDSGYSVNNRGPIATLLQSFSASLGAGGVQLEWTLSAVDKGIEFFILRSMDGGAFTEVDRSRLESTGLAYRYVDGGVVPGSKYAYRVEYEAAGRRALLFTTQEIETPDAPLTLDQNRPNPFNPSTTISFHLPIEAAVTIDIYDIGGRLVTRLLRGERQTAGYHEVVWNGRDSAGREVASGLYVYRLVTGKETLSRKMVLLK